MQEKLPDACAKDLACGCDELQLSLTTSQQDALLDYLALLCRWNKAYNLTAIRDPLEMLHKHVLDSLAIVPHITGKRILDVGSGGGIPGIILAIVRPESEYVLLDSNGKKTRFMTQAKIELGLANVEVQQNRAESYYPDRLFDSIVSRAFTALDNMLNLCQHLVLEEGEFWAMKGDYPEPNQKPIPKPWKIKQAVPLHVPFVDAQRHLIVIGRSEE
ncbi:MAG: 16S rRNA (guanine(527)-N(7))-methyltransferase RsmG [Gammaproteobacteria bacterium]|nr:16S rRNA (guanine(527)-N(7))-methyltransferase RsmG [Gammaproteobacteria bacterium]NNJ71642.1 16S rRNA (guanine(527)-N(7))-methyltransferase RsmG [Enterobacterales bacterium]